MKIPIEVSARHVHLSKKDKELLFGKGYKLKLMKKLSQPGQFAAKETVTVVGPKDKIENVRILGPCRSQTQVEISYTDGRRLGIRPPVRLSGDIKSSEKATLVGPKGKVDLEEGVIVAERHIHASSKEAKKLGICDGDRVKVDISGIRDLLFENVPVRVDPDFKLAFHIDTDEANAAWLETGDFGELIK